jgi:hypothetical protein
MRVTNAAEGVRAEAMASTPGCRVCSGLKEFQTNLIEVVGPERVSHLCNYHAWALAKAAPAEVAADVFLGVLKKWRDQADTVGKSCDVCRCIRDFERGEIRKAVEEFDAVETAATWCPETLCLFHSRMVAASLPREKQIGIARMISRNAGTLCEELEALLEESKQRRATGWGVLGRTAEFLVSQRGILHEEGLCSDQDQQKK